MTPIYMPEFVWEPSVLMNMLWTDLPWENREGAPRRECWFNPYGREYTYGSGEHARTYQAHPLDDREYFSYAIAGVMATLNHQTGASYDCCFVNGYAHGRQHLGWHSDDSPEMDQAHPIATVSLGAEREIWFREKPHAVLNRSESLNNESLTKITLEAGSACIMPAGMQQTHQHRIPKSPLGDACGARISLTYRRLV